MSQRNTAISAFEINPIRINAIDPVLGARAFGLISLVLVLLITNGGAG